MTVRELKQRVQAAGHSQIEAWLLLIDTLHDFKQAVRHGAPTAKKAVPAICRRPHIGWKDRHVRRGTALAAICRCQCLMGCQTEEARELLKHYASQIFQFEGKIPVRTREVVHDSGSWISAIAWTQATPKNTTGKVESTRTPTAK